MCWHRALVRERGDSQIEIEHHNIESADSEINMDEEADRHLGDVKVANNATSSSEDDSNDKDLDH